MNIEWQWQQENAKLQLEIQELQKVLGFYADKDNYKYKLGEFRGVRRIVKVEMDGGEMARKILEGYGCPTVSVATNH